MTTRLHCPSRSPNTNTTRPRNERVRPLGSGICSATVLALRPGRRFSRSAPAMNDAPEGPCQTARIESVRIDQWLAAVRITKTRSDAAAACRGGHVKINDETAKPSSPLKVGDHVEARVNQRQRIVDVTKLITKRVSAVIAVDCFDDRSPPPPEQDAFRPCSPSVTAEPAARRTTCRPDTEPARS